MKNLIIVLTLTLILFDSEAQEQFRSSRYGYTFTILSGWRIKDQIVIPGTDAKIVDGRGNSFIVSINSLPLEYGQMNTVDLLSNSSDKDLIDIFAPTEDNAYILRRGITVISGKEFYFIHMSSPFQGNLRLIHKMFMYNWKGKAISIDCASISSMSEECSVYFDIMLRTFKLN